MTVTVIPQSPAELEEMLHDSTTLMRLVKDEPDSFAEFVKKYARSQMDLDSLLATQVREQTQIVLAAMMKDADNARKGGQPAVPLNFNPIDVPHQSQQIRKQGLYNKLAKGAPLDGIYANQAEFLQAIWHRADRLENSKDLAGKLDQARQIQNSFGSNVPADGGFLIPEVLRSTLLEWSLESSLIRPRATVIPMDSLRVPIPMIDSTSNASSVFGGIVGYWTEEGAALVESQASFGQVMLDAKKLTAYAAYPNELIADAPAFSGFIDQRFPQALSFFEDYAFMRGTGVGEPLGWVNCPASVQVAAEAGQPSGSIVWENVVKMYARMMPTSLSSAVWIASIDTFPQLATMALSVGTGGNAVWLGNQTSPGSGVPPVSILGRPVLFTEKTPTVGTTGDLCFVDLSYYLIGDRMQMQASSSPHYLFANDKTAYRIIQRVDGRPWLQSAITQKNNSSNTLTPFVQIATR